MKNIDIEQLDSEEKSKIRELVRERNDNNREGGVDYIFRRNVDKEQYLLGKKLDVNEMAKDDKALMGESETEFQERMEHRKMLEKMREDPMSIIQMNEQQARKVAFDKKRVRDRFNERNKPRYNRMSGSDDSDTDESEPENCDYLAQLRSLLAKHEDEDDRPLDDVLALRSRKNNVKQSTAMDSNQRNKKRSKEKHRSPINTTRQHRNRQNMISRYRSSSIENNKRNERRNLERARSRDLSNTKKLEHNQIKEKHSISTNRRRSRSTENKRKRSRSVEKKRQKSRSVEDKRRKSRSTKQRERKLESIEQKQRRSRSINKNYNKYNKPPTKSLLSEEEKQRRIEEMKQNAQEHNLRCTLLEKRYQRENEKEAIEIEKQMKNHDVIMLSNAIKMNQNYTLEQCLDEKRKQARVKDVFKK